MPHAKLTLSIPDGVWVGDLTGRHPDATVRVLAAHLDGEDGVGLAEVLADDTAPVLATLAEYDALDVEILERGADRALVQFETGAPLPLLAAREAGIPLETPFEVRDGEIHWEITASHDRLSELGESLEALGISFTVRSLRGQIPEEQLLTDRQRRLVTAAIDAGYYDTPREASLTDLADRLDLAKSTASETLHRAEEKIVKQYATSLSEPAIPTQ